MFDKFLYLNNFLYLSAFLLQQYFEVSGPSFYPCFSWLLNILTTRNVYSKFKVPNMITITDTKHNTSTLNIRNTATGTCPTIINFHSCDIIINVLFLYRNCLLTLFHQSATLVTEKCLVWTHETIQMLKIDGASNNVARDCIYKLNL